MRGCLSFKQFIARKVALLVLLLGALLVYAQETGEAERKARQNDLLSRLRAKTITEDELPELVHIGDAEAIPVLEEAFWTWWPDEKKLQPYVGTLRVSYGIHNPYGHLDYILEVISKIGGREAEASLGRILDRLKETGRSGYVEFEKSDLQRLQQANKVIELMQNPQALGEVLKAGGEDAGLVKRQAYSPFNGAVRRAILYADLAAIEDEAIRATLVEAKITALAHGFYRAY